MNIFARELKEILQQHGKTLGSLYGLRSDTFYIFPNKVTRLKHSLTHDMTATLNAEELDFLQEWVPLDAAGADLRRLRAALLAEAVRHLVGGRMPREIAAHLGEQTLQLLLEQEPDQVLLRREELLQAVRGMPSAASSERGALRGVGETPPPESDPTQSAVERALEVAIETYEQGALWLEVARETSERGARRGYLAQAQALLGRARELTIDAPTRAQGTPEQQTWLALIEQTLTEAATLG